MHFLYALLLQYMFPLSYQFFVGSIGMGAPVHWHGNAWNVCAYGQRRWFLFPPSSSMYSNVPIKQWLEVIQRPVQRHYWS
jgi:hypothetical protein